MRSQLEPAGRGSDTPASNDRPARAEAEAAPPPSRRRRRPGQVTFEGEEPGTTIVVKPPSRLGPIWTPEEYKKKRAGQLKY